MLLSRERDRFKKKSAEAERECESLRGLRGAKNVSRNFIDGFHKKREVIVEPAVENKENQSYSNVTNVGRGTGGISFVIE